MSAAMIEATFRQPMPLGRVSFVMTLQTRLNAIHPGLSEFPSIEC